MESLDGRLVVGVSSRALFDLETENEIFEKYGVTPSSLYIQEMENRWGSCTPKGKIILNAQLIKVPRPCIEYVITHELCHLVHPDHTKAFWELLQKEMPDWERWKNKLERFML